MLTTFATKVWGSLGKLLYPVTTAFQPKTVWKLFYWRSSNQPKRALVETVGSNRTPPLWQTSDRYISTILFNYFFDTFCTNLKKELKDSKRMTARGRSTSRDDVEEKKKRMVNQPYWKHKNSWFALPCGISESVKTSGKCRTDWSSLVQHSTMAHQMKTSPRPLCKIANGMQQMPILPTAIILHRAINLPSKKDGARGTSDHSITKWRRSLGR